MKALVVSSILCSFIFCSCNESGKLNKTIILQKEISTLQKSIELQVASLIQLRNNINIQSRPLNTDEIEKVTQIDHIELTYSIWKKNYGQLGKMEQIKVDTLYTALKIFLKNLKVIKTQIDEVNLSLPTDNQ